MPRVVVPGLPLHVIQRGNNRQAIFYTDQDYYRFHADLRAASERFDCAIHAYVYMTNHVHLLVTPSTRQGISRMMQSAGRRYVRYINDVYTRSGTLWEGRFKSALIDSDRYLLACSRYIEMNPVRARMTDLPQDYRWSSYRHNAMGEADPMLSPHALYQALGIGPAERQMAYRRLFKETLAENDLLALRKATNDCTLLGSDIFQTEIAAMLARRVKKHAHGGDRRSERYKQSTG
jgi:putative transposase